MSNNRVPHWLELPLAFVGLILVLGLMWLTRADEVTWESFTGANPALTSKKNDTLP